MKEKESPKLGRKSSSGNLMRTVSKLMVLDVKLKNKAHQKAAAAKSSLAKKKSGGRGDTSETKKEVSFSAETKPPDDSEPPEQDDMLPVLDEEETENTPREENGEEGEKEGGEGGEEGAETKSTEGQEEKEKGGEEEDESKKGGKKGKKKGKSKKDKREEARKRAAAKKEAEQPVGEVTVGKEHFRSFIFEKVQGALSIVCTDGVTSMNVDNVQPLMRSLDLDPSQEAIMDLIKDSLIDNFGEMNPLDVDRVVQAGQEANELTEMDDCLEVAFKVIDFDEDGFITQADIYQLMLRLGEMLADYALDDMLAAVDMDGDGKISLRDFRYFLLGRDVPSRKEIFAMAAEAKKKREEAETKAEEDAERQKFEMLKSGQCAPEPQPEEDSLPDAQGEGEEREDKDKKKQDGGQENVQDKVEEERSIAVEADVDVKAVAEVKENNDIPSNSPSEGEILRPLDEGGGAEVEPEAESLTEKNTEPSSGESEEIQEKRETLFSASSQQDKARVSSDDISSPVEVSPSSPSNTVPVSVNSLPLPLPSDGDKWRQSRRSSCASSAGGSEDDFNFRSRSPIPLVSLAGEGAGPLHLDVPPPDMSIVHAHAPSPLPTPMETPIATPRRRPTIVGIGGLAVGGVCQDDTDQELVNAIEVLRQQMTGREGNLVPERPHRRRNSRHSIVDGDGVNTVEDVEDFNNRLVFKLPPRRRSSTAPFPTSSRRNSRDERQEFDQRTLLKGHEGAGADSDEGIGLADEEVIVKSVYRASGSQAPPPSASALLRISLPSGESEEPWVEHVPKPGPLPPPIVTVDPHEAGFDSGKKTGNGVPQLPAQQNQWLAVMPNEDIESPRSFVSKSELSAMNTSLTSPRTDDAGSDEDDLQLLLTKRSDTSDGRVSSRRPMSSRTMTTARSAASDYELDADSVICSINDDTMSVSSNQRQVRYAIDEDEDMDASEDIKPPENSPRIKSGRLTPTKSPSNSKAPQKASIPCNTIELKELDLKSPVSADQLSNRKRFGMIPKNVSKFLVLGKSPVYAESTSGVNTARSEQYVNSKGAVISRKLSPTLRLSSQENLTSGVRRRRPQTAITHRERDILQNRRISLMEDEILPLYDPHRNFDSPSALDQGGGSGAIEITTSLRPKNPSDGDTMSQVKQMERRILKRSKTSFDLMPVHEGSAAFNDVTPRVNRPTNHRAASSASLLRREQTTPRLLANHNADSGSGKPEETKGSFTRSIVPITRVVMAYQNARKRRQSREFNSLSRELERSGKPQYSAAKSRDHSSPYALDLSGCKAPRSGKKKQHHVTSHRKHSGRRNSTRSGVFGRKRIEAQEEPADFPLAGEDVPTLVGDLSDPDVIPDDIIFEKYRPHTTGGYRHRHRHAQRTPQSSILTLELPRDACHTPKVKSVSLLSKLPIK